MSVPRSSGIYALRSLEKIRWRNILKISYFGLISRILIKKFQGLQHCLSVICWYLKSVYIRSIVLYEAASRSGSNALPTLPWDSSCAVTLFIDFFKMLLFEYATFINKFCNWFYFYLVILLFHSLIDTQLLVQLHDPSWPVDDRCNLVVSYTKTCRLLLHYTNITVSIIPL